MTEVISDIMKYMRLSGCVYFQRDFCAPWAMRMADTGFAQFHVITSGACVVEVDGAWHDVGTGDVLFFPHGATHVLADRAGRQPVEGGDYMAALGNGTPMFTQGPSPTRMICGHYAYRDTGAHPLLSDLPVMVHVTAHHLGASSPTSALLHLIMDELTHREPGYELSVERLAEVLLMQVLRVHYRAQDHSEGFFAGLRDKRLNRAITRIHSDFAGPLTLADLAESAAMSRTAFARRFSSVVRMTPVDYLQHWRMLVAQDLLSSTDRPISDIAEDVGYGSDIAFSRAYKRRFGVSPSAARYSP